MTSTKPIEAAVKVWVDSWSSRDKAALMGLWDSEDPEATYLAGEQEESLVGRDAVENYISTLCDLFDDIRHRPQQVIVKRLSENVGLVFYVLNWAVADTRGPIGGQCRVTAVWHRRGENWKLTHYAESPLAPLVELKEFYQHVAAQGLPA